MTEEYYVEPIQTQEPIQTTQEPIQTTQEPIQPAHEQLTKTDLDVFINSFLDISKQNSILRNEILVKNDKILQLIDAKQIIEDALIGVVNMSDKSIEHYEETIDELKQKITTKNRIIRKLYKFLKQDRE